MGRSTGVVAAGEVIGSVFLAADELLGVEELPICASAHLIHHGGLQVHHHTTRHVLARACLAEECVERIVSSSHRLVTWHLPVGLHILGTTNSSWIRQFKYIRN